MWLDQRFGKWTGQAVGKRRFGRLASAGAASAQLPRAGSRRFGVVVEADPVAGWLVVDLQRDLFSGDWWRGAVTLALLVGSAAWLATGPATRSLNPMSAEAMRQSEADGVGALNAGSPAGIAMAPNERVEPLTNVPERMSVEFAQGLSAGDGVGAMLARSGASLADAARVEALVRGAAGGGLRPGTMVAVSLGRRLGDGLRPVQYVGLRASLDTRLIIRRVGDGLSLSHLAVPVDTRPLKISGSVGDGLYWSLRSAGVSPSTASDYLQALAREMDVGGEDVTPLDRFELVVDQRRAATGEVEIGALQYAGFHHVGGQPVQMVRIDGGWTDAAAINAPRAQSSGMIWPVAARITSTFGLRFHPILHLTRMHKGIDFGAHFGSPVVATADGVVARASWAGGYGQQVRISHAGNMATSYSHLSRMLVTPGTVVRRGQLIAYSGSTGLSTGPHLHYEVMRGGVAVNPMSVGLVSGPAVDAGLAVRVKARLKQLLG